tara:strand:+ start:4577 stop:4924 length:348 start_codon:yes stop_codon:yes gene_type:complete
MKLNNKILGGVCSIIILIYVLYLFQFEGVRSVLAMVLIYVIPTYMILNNFNLETDEKIFFSLFLGLSLFTLAVWFVDRILPSLKLSLFVTFILVVGVGFLLKRYRTQLGLTVKEE